MIDKFGFLPEECRLECEEFKISPVDEFDALIKDIKSQLLYRDGFLYPHYECKTHMYKLQHTHIIELKKHVSSDDKKKLRLVGILGFVMHLIGYVYGRRLQFYDWWFDSRLSFDRQHNISITEESFKQFITNALSKFNSWGEERRRVFINILYMHNRAPSYEWDWERFALEYMVFDACWKFSDLRENRHRERIRKICDEYGLYKNEDEINRIVGLRNNLFHEGLWSKGQPGTAGDAKDFYASYNLRRLNNRLIPALLECNSKYISSNWTSLGCYIF